ncbi:TatD family hydrolase [Alphaproteobacteria bacterium]|nr:TatD family hydrolase [Alphaproteobacteria bacterium]
MLTDAHVNFSHKDLINSVDQIITEGREGGVARFLAVNSNIYDVETDYNLVKNYDFVDLTIGHHPYLCNEVDENSLRDLFNKHLKNYKDKIKIIGETGLDFSYDANPTNQINSFKLHIETAIINELPILIHVRDAFEETYKIISEYKSELKTVLIHCFTGDDEYAEKFNNLDCYFSITGIITFKNAEKLRSTIKKLPKNKIFFETDAPYLTPVPMRGEINKPSLLRHIIEYYCELTKEDFSHIANISTKNYERFISCQP